MSIGAFAGSALALALQSTVTLSPLRLALAMVFGAVIAAALGFLIGIPVLRLNGDYLAIVTLAFGEIIKSIITNVYLGVDENGLQFSFLSNKNELADGGVELIRGPMGVMNTQRISTFIAGFVLVLIALVVIFNLVNSRTGRAVMAARDNRIAAESVGISVTKYKMIAFVVSAALAGAAGTLYGCSQTTFAATKFDFNTSILILVFVVLGGLGNMWGSVIAAAALTILPEALRQFSNYRMLVYAIVLILVMLATNNPTLKGFFSRLFHRERADAPPCGGGERRRQAVSSIKRPETKLVPVPSVNKIPERDVDKSPHPGGPAPGHRLRRPHRRQRVQHGHRPHRDRRPDRPQRRGQDHGVQPADQGVPAHPGHRPAGRSRHPQHEHGAGQQGGYCPHLPEHPPV